MLILPAKSLCEIVFFARYLGDSLRQGELDDSVKEARTVRLGDRSTRLSIWKNAGDVLDNAMPVTSDHRPACSLWR